MLASEREEGSKEMAVFYFYVSWVLLDLSPLWWLSGVHGFPSQRGREKQGISGVFMAEFWVHLGGALLPMGVLEAKRRE